MSGPTARRASHRDRLSKRVGGERGSGLPAYWALSLGSCPQGQNELGESLLGEDG